MPEQFLATYAGAIALYTITRQNNLQPFSLLSAVGVSSGNPIVVTLDMLMSCLLGSYLVFLLAAPSTTAQAAVAGLGMSGLLSAFARKTAGAP